MDTLSTQILFSVLFYFSGTIYAAIGFFVLSLNVKSTLNRLFFLICSSLAVWAFAYSLAHSAPTHGSALLWHQISAFGWGTVHSLTLHYYLVFTQRHKLLKQPLVYLFLYAPALATLVLFGPLGSLAAENYELVYFEVGWLDVSAPNISNRFFEAYYLIYSTLSLCTLWFLNQNRSKSSMRKTVSLISIAYLLTLIFSTITDVVLRPTLANPVPQIGVFFALFTLCAIFYATIQHGLMTEIAASPKSRTHVLNDVNRIRTFYCVALLFISGSTLNMIGYFYKQNSLFSSIFISSLLLFCGVVIIFLPRVSFSQKIQDYVLIILLSGIYLLLMLHFVNSSSSNIIWPAPLLFMLISAVFNRKKMLVIIMLSAMLTQTVIWIKVPEQTVMINMYDHMRRLATILLGAILAYYVNRLYVKRLIENEANASLQRMVSKISASLIRVSPENLGEKLNQLLEMIGHHFGVDRSYLFFVSKDQSTATYAHEWCGEGTNSALEQVGTIPTTAFPWWMENLTKNQAVHISDVANLPPEATAEQEILDSQQIKSLLAVPVINEGMLIGFMGFDSVRRPMKWEENHRETLGILANMISDAIMKIRNEEKINYMAYYDSLTGLANRSLLNNRLKQAIALAQRTEKYLGLLFLDLDSFKAVNDTMGHEGGDQILIQTAAKLNQRLRQTDTVCRFGGDEFLILFPQMDQPEEIKAAAEKVMQIFNEPMVVQDQEFFVTASGGISIYPADGTEAESLVKNADLAMYTAKDQGKNQVVFCTPVMKETVSEKMRLTNHLYRAMERQELILHYQPQINVATRKIVGVEALIRWQHPTKGIILPGLFIPLAEQTGLINPIGRWVLETACRQNKAWQDKGLTPVTMAVNLSVEQFRNPKLVDTVAQVLEETHLASAWLELEITESIAIKEAEYIITMLQQLKDLGVTIAIDDFGTEYSSLSRLKALPIDRIKMAMEFVHGITNGPKDEAIAQVIINLAKSLNLRVIAEGVETEYQMNFLTDRVCDDVQGFYFHKPMSADEVEALMSKLDSNYHALD